VIIIIIIIIIIEVHPFPVHIVWNKFHRLSLGIFRQRETQQ